MSDSIRLNAYGRLLSLRRDDSGWRVYHLGGDGKRRAAGMVIPSSVTDVEAAVTFIADTLHEWATETHPDVQIVNRPG